MSAAANSSAYWRIAGMSYLKYANACAEIVRGALKEPHLSKVRLRFAFGDRSAFPRLTSFLYLSRNGIKQARVRDAVYFKQTKYVKGTPESAVVTEVIPAEGVAKS